MGREFSHLTEDPHYSVLITNFNCYEDISNKLDLYKTLKLSHEFYKVNENLESVLGSNLDHNLPTEKYFGQPKVDF